MIDWFQTASCFSNWDLESEMAAPWMLNSLIHTGQSALPQRVKTTITLRDTNVTWRAVRKAFGLPFLLTKSMPLWCHPEFFQHNNYNMYNRDLRDRGVFSAVCIWKKKDGLHLVKSWLDIIYQRRATLK